MKTFNFVRIEYHEVERYFEAQISEDEIRQIFKEAGVNTDQHEELLQGLQDQDHAKHKEAVSLLMESPNMAERWKFSEDLFISLDDGSYDVDIALDSVDDSNDFYSTAFPYSRRLH